MCDNPDYFRVLSLHLNCALSDIGVNSLTVHRRRSTCLFREKLASLCHLKKNWSVYIFGSQSEGSTTLDLDSDTDSVYCLDDIRVIDAYSDWGRDQINYLMLHEDTPPGYCRLQLLRSDVPLAAENPPDDNFVYDCENRILLKNTADLMRIKYTKHSRSGPALTISPFNMYSNDIVPSLNCKTCPVQYDPWRNRCRGNWPPRDIVQTADQDGVLLVPTGCKLSEYEILEWRISFSHLERRLMFSLNMVQLKCYVILKMTVKSLIVPNVGASISSYHCKTALFYCIEQTGTAFWTEENLLQGITQCLGLLLSWIQDGHCPHFIIPQSNLFAGKVHSRNTHQLASLFISILNSRGRFLLQLSMDFLAPLLQLRIHGNRWTKPLQKARELKTIKTLTIVDITKMQKISFLESRCIMNNLDVSQMTLIAEIRADMRLLLEHATLADKYGRQAIFVNLEILAGLLGSLLTSVSVSRGDIGLPPEARSWFRMSGAYDINTRLKLASAYFCSASYEEAEGILLELETRFARELIEPICPCLPHTIEVPNFKFGRQLCTTKNWRKRMGLYANCVMFGRQEFHCAPPALRSEMFRSVGHDMAYRMTHWDKWMGTGATDCLPFMFYLQYLNYGQLGKRRQQIESMYNIEVCIRTKDNLHHLETTWNLLGQCMELENNPKRALECYRASLQIRKRNNAANWHVATLVYRQMVKTMPPV